MPKFGDHVDRARIASAGLAVILHALALYALLAGLGVAPSPATESALKLFDVGEPPPPPPPALEEPPRETAADAPEDAPAPPNLRASPAPIVVPPPAIRLDRPSPVVAAPVAGPGADPSAGASDRAGPGTGAGGLGTGLGGGGDGGGGEGGSPMPAYKLSGELMPLPLPRRLYRQGADITFRIAVGPDGRVTACAVHRMTGAAEIGEIACRAIIERYRYQPAYDAQGRAVASVDYENHAWGTRSWWDVF